MFDWLKGHTIQLTWRWKPRQVVKLNTLTSLPWSYLWLIYRSVSFMSQPDMPYIVLPCIISPRKAAGLSLEASRLNLRERLKGTTYHTYPHWYFQVTPTAQKELLSHQIRWSDLWKQLWLKSQSRSAIISRFGDSTPFSKKVLIIVCERVNGRQIEKHFVC